jgi:hypothetical protein
VGHHQVLTGIMLDIMQLFHKVCHVVGHGATPYGGDPQRASLREDVAVSWTLCWQVSCLWSHVLMLCRSVRIFSFQCLWYVETTFTRCILTVLMYHSTMPSMGAEGWSVSCRFPGFSNTSCRSHGWSSSFDCHMFLLGPLCSRRGLSAEHQPLLIPLG